MGVIGLIMLPGAVVGVVCGLGAGIIFDHRGVRGITLAGAGIFLVGASATRRYPRARRCR